MKKISIMLWATFALAACSQDAVEELGAAQEAGGGSRLTVRACTGGEDTRVATEDGLNFTLTEGQEQIGLYLCETVWTQENVLFEAAGTDERGWLIFTTSKFLPLGLQSTTKVLAYAPYRETQWVVSGSTGDAPVEGTRAAAWDGMRPFDLPSEQTQKRGGDATAVADYYALAAYPSTPTAQEDGSYSVDLHFAGVFALARFNVRNNAEGASELTVKRLTLSAEGAALTGLFRADLNQVPALTDDTYAVEPVEGRTEKSVTVQLAEPVVLAAGAETSIYAVVHAEEIVNPVIKVYAEQNGAEVVFTRKIEQTVALTRKSRTQFGMTLENPAPYDYAQEVAEAVVAGGKVRIDRDVTMKGKVMNIPQGVTTEIEIAEGVTFVVESNSLANEGGNLTISGGGTIESDGYTVDNYGGTLTIKDCTLASTSTDKLTATVYNAQNGVCEIEGATIRTANVAVQNNGAKSCSIRNSTIVSTNENEYCIIVYGNSKLTVDNSDITGGFGGIKAEGGSETVFNSGSVTVTGLYYAIYASSYPDWYGPAKVTVNDGKFTKTNDQSVCVYRAQNCDIVVNGGYFKDMGNSNGTGFAPADGCKLVRLSEPLVENDRVYNYRVVEAENPWQGGVSEPSYDEASKTWTIADAAELAWVAEQVNGKKTTFSGETLLLAADIDLNGRAWTPIGNVASYPGITFAGTFDGQEHTIANMNAEDLSVGSSSAGFFGSITGVVKNVKFVDATVTSRHYAGVVVGYSSSNVGMRVENCHVDGATVYTEPELMASGSYDNGDKAGGIIGYCVTGDVITGCSVKNATITAYRDLGGIAGCSDGTLSDNSVEGTTVVQSNKNAYMSKPITTIGEILGRDKGATLSNNTAVNVTLVVPVAENTVSCNGTTYESIAAAIAANPDEKAFSLSKGTFTLPGSDLNGLAFTGQEGTVINLVGMNPTRYSDVSFNDLAFELGTDNYHGFQHAGTVTFNGCTFNGRMCSYGTEIYNDCIFNQTTADYCMWVYGGSVEYRGCTFNGSGKFLNVYNEGVDTTVSLLCRDCKFVSSVSNKAAVNVKTLCEEKPLKFDVKILNCTLEGSFPETNGGLWQTDSASSDTVTITVDGVQVFPAAN